MRLPRYNTSSIWFKGNTHLHSTASDGGKNFEELAELYHSAGYDFLFRTDHWVASDVSQDNGTSPLLWLDGIELDGYDHTGAPFHVVCLGKLGNMHREDGLISSMQSAAEQGALRILAHPHWMGNSFADSLRWDFDGVEVYNHVCNWLNGKGGGLVHWDATLVQNPNTLSFSVDDGHLRPEHPGWDGGWIMVNAEVCTEPEIMHNIRSGNFYSTCGPEIQHIQTSSEVVSVRTSAVQFIRLVGPRSQGQRVGSYDDETFTYAEFTIPEDWDYAYLELEDEHHRRAWTNNLLIEREER